MAYQLNEDLTQWLTQHALDLDQSSKLADETFDQLSAAGLFALGVPVEFGGTPDTQLEDAAWAVAEVAKYSLSAAFMLWAQRCFISYLLLHPKAPLSAALIHDAVQGRVAGATGLSNAIKFIGGVEGLQTTAQTTDQGWVLNGYLPWVSNLHTKQFYVVVAADRGEQSPGVFALRHDDPGVIRNPDLALHCMQGSNTASIHIEQCQVSAERLIAESAADFIQIVRPQFLTLQSALSTGVSLRCLDQVLNHPRANAKQKKQAAEYQARIIAIQNELCAGSNSGVFLDKPAELFALRIELAQLCQAASLLELQAEGGASFLQGLRDHTQRRLREALFLPMVSPSISQLQAV